jgi:hypothetical protein
MTRGIGIVTGCPLRAVLLQRRRDGHATSQKTTHVNLYTNVR